jgi:hypothetical protein
MDGKPASDEQSASWAEPLLAMSMTGFDLTYRTCEAWSKYRIDIDSLFTLGSLLSYFV